MFFVNVASKGLSVRVSGLKSTLTDTSISVDYKRVTDAFSALRYHFLASVADKGVAGWRRRKGRTAMTGDQ